MPDKQSGTTWDSFSRMYPGSRLEEGRKMRFPAMISCDDDGAFKSVFDREVVRRGGRVRRSLEYRSQTNAFAERNLSLGGGSPQLEVHKVYATHEVGVASKNQTKLG